MSCFRPFYRADVESHPGRLSMINAHFRRDRSPYNGGVFCSSVEYDSLRSEMVKSWFVPIPCGRCSGCVIDYSKQWAARTIIEAREHKFNYFVTLTYNNAHLPFRPMIRPDTGEYIEIELVKKDFQDFMKRLRQKCKEVYNIDGIRFMACGEYGSKNGRPHYHACLMGMPDLTSDLKLWSIRDGVRLYRSSFIESCWRDPKKGHEKEPIGFVTVGEVTWKSACYVARYVLKKRENHVKKADREDWFEIAGNLGEDVEGLGFPQEEFFLMSRRPGLAKAYYDENKNVIMADGKLAIPLDDGAKLIRLPKYYDYLYDIDEPDLAAEMKEKRRASAEEAQRRRTEATGLDQRTYERLADERQQRRNRRLQRQ